MNGLNELIKAIEELRRSRVKELIDTRIKEFKENKNKPINKVFEELCFCLLTANFNAEKSLNIQNKIGDGFLNLSEHELIEKLKDLGHRFPVRRAKYIVEARKMKEQIKKHLQSSMSGRNFREWLAENVKGLGYKEASHFLRNIGYMDLSIIDFHIINILSRYCLIEKPKTITRRRYLEIEGVLRDIAKRAGLSLGELDLYLWYMETGKVLK